MGIPRAPEGAGPSGRRLWRAVLGEFELEEHERALVVALVRQVDRLDALEALVAAEGLMTEGAWHGEGASGGGGGQGDGYRGGADRRGFAASGW